MIKIRLIKTLFIIALIITFSCEKTIEIDADETDYIESSECHEDINDYIWDISNVIPIILNGNSITVESGNVTVDGSVVTIDSAGDYRISGQLTDGKIIVNTTEKKNVRLILNGVDINSTKNAPIYIENAYKTILILEENTENMISDASSYNDSYDESNAAIFSKDNLSIYGEGLLSVNGNYNDGITSKDGLVINSGNITVNSTDDGIRGKNYLIIKDGNISIISGGDGLKSDNEDSNLMGYVTIEKGDFNILARGDAIQAETGIEIMTGEFELISGGGSSNSVSWDESLKGIKADTDLIIHGGNYQINSADDGIHSNNNLIINGGTFSISSNDDGIHADVSVEVNNASIDISKSVEGIESASISVNESKVRIIASDDGFNATQGTRTEFNDNSYLTINSGYVYVNTSSGDALDSNGNIVINGGTIIAHGPSSDPEVGMDYNGVCKIAGGTTIISGPSSHMTQAPSSSSIQNSVLIKFNSRQSANSIINIQDSEGNNILTFAPVRNYQSIIFSSSDLVIGSTYTIYTGGSCTGTEVDGFYQDGDYQEGVKYKSFTVSGTLTNIY